MGDFSVFPQDAGPPFGPEDLKRLSQVLAGSMVGTSGIDTPAALCRACVDLLDVTGASVSLTGGDAQTLWWSSDPVAAQLAEAQYTLGDGPCQSALAMTAPVAPVDNVRDHVFGDRPWLAADPVLGPWEKLTEAIEMFGDLDDLATTVDRVVADGWTPVHGHVSTRSELDAYEWACWGSLASWALDHPADPARAQVLETATARRSQWLHGYRDSFGFLCLVLRRTSD
ncbi:SAM-dependent methyltransferase [Streptomyces sp. NPDC127114]|uniref:SAM-dependent methyltransferase n=1 Tax=Streptomyces sp. NPDC127114 TaxID=3345366 RepID=UPI003625D3EA